MYVIVRGDLDMTAGKLSAMTGHAFKLLTKNLIENDPLLTCDYFADGMGTNVVLKSKNESQIMRAQNDISAAGIFHAIVTDEGHIMPPHFDGNPIVAAIGIGPCKRADIHHITKKFNLVQ